MSFSQKNIFFTFFIFLLGGILGMVISPKEITSTWAPVDIFSSPKIEEVKKVIEKEYYKFSLKKKEDIENGVITSLVSALGDKHSTYFPQKEAKEFSEVLRGDFEGIWAVIDEHMRGIIIRKVFPSSPAEKAWLWAWDIITHVGDVSLIGMSVEDAVKKIRWPKWSQAVLKFLHGDLFEEKSVTVTRDMILLPSTTEKMLTGSVWYIEVAFFWDHTTEEFKKSLENVIHSWATSIILDFRNNGWGYLDTSVDLLSLFLPSHQVAVRTRENHRESPEEYMTYTTEETNTKIPLVIIVNSLSASATEIFAWALQDYGRAIIVGEKTYGKWSVQTPFVLEDGSILKLTIGRWFTPKDKSIDGNGITPDIVIPLFDRDFSQKFDRQLDGAYKIIQSLSGDKDTKKTIESFSGSDFSK